jgi:hypothetical protein
MITKVFADVVHQQMNHADTGIVDLAVSFVTTTPRDDELWGDPTILMTEGFTGHSAHATGPQAYLAFKVSVHRQSERFQTERQIVKLMASARCFLSI